MQYSPKLKRVMLLLQDIVEREGVAASIILHEPPFSEYLLHLKTPYSCAFLEGNSLRIRANRDNFPSLEAQKKTITDTINMLEHLRLQSELHAHTFEAMLQLLRKKFIIDQDTPRHTGQSELDN